VKSSTDIVARTQQFRSLRNARGSTLWAVQSVQKVGNVRRKPFFDYGGIHLMKKAANGTPDDAGKSTIGISGKDFPVMGP
jgi:hypothetical protein